MYIFLLAKFLNNHNKTSNRFTKFRVGGGMKRSLCPYGYPDIVTTTSLILISNFVANKFANIANNCKYSQKLSNIYLYNIFEK